MKRSTTRRAVRSPARLRSIAVGAILLASCVTAPVGEKSTERTVAFTTYTVPAPEGDGWEVTRDATKETVSFRRQKTTLLGELVASSYILVFKVPLSEEAVAMSEEALAGGFLEQEHQGMLELGVARNQYRLGEVKKAVETIGGRKLYTMRYTTEAPRPGISPLKNEAALFLYVPPDYAPRRAFYAFLIQESWATGSVGGLMYPRDLGRIEPVIAGFTIRSGTPPAEPHAAPQPEVGHPDVKHLGCPEVGGRASDAPGARGNARWGMTVDEVVAAFPGEAVRASPAEIEKGSGPVRIDNCEIAGTHFQANFFFYRASRLTQITLGPSSKRDASRPLFDRLAKMLAEKHGQPTTDIPDQSMGVAGLRTTQRSWEAADARIALTYMYGGPDPFLQLIYNAPPRPNADKN